MIPSHYLLTRTFLKVHFSRCCFSNLDVAVTRLPAVVTVCVSDVASASCENPSNTSPPPCASPEHAVLLFATQHGLSERATNELLALIHGLVRPEAVDQARLLPRTARTLRQHVLPQIHSIQHDLSDGQSGGMLVDELVVAGGAIRENFHYFDVRQVLESLLATTHQKFELQHQRRRVVSTGERFFDELVSGDWWMDCERTVRARNRNHSLLSIILYVDGVVVDFFGKVSMTPIMLTLGNLPVAQRQTIAAKRLLGFVPALREDQIRDRTSTASSAVRRGLLHAAFARFVYPSDF